MGAGDLGMTDAGIARTPKSPYYAVIFTSVRTPVGEGYPETAERMLQLAAQQPGYLGVESTREGALGITVSYWQDLPSIKSWKPWPNIRLPSGSDASAGTVPTKRASAGLKTTMTLRVQPEAMGRGPVHDDAPGLVDAPGRGLSCPDP
jgi:hypothetical protein